MPQTTVRAPDGTKVVVNHPEGASEEDIRAYAKENASYTKATEQQEAPKPISDEQADTTVNYIQGLFETVGKGALLGGMDELQGLIRAGVDAIQGSTAFEGDPSVDQSKPTFASSIESFTQDSREHQQSFADANPATALAVELVSGLLTGSASVKAAAKLGATGKAATGAAVGATEGGIYGFLAEEGGLGERAEAGIMYGAGGAVFGGAIGGVANKFAQRQAKKKVEEAHQAINQISDSIIIHMAQGEPIDMAVTLAKRQANLTDEGLKAAVNLTKTDGVSRKIRIPGSVAQAKAIAPDIIKARANGTHDSTTLLARYAHKTADFADSLFGIASTRIKKVSPALFGRARKFEFDTKTKTQAYAGRVEALKGVRKLGQQQQNAFAKAVSNGDIQGAMAVLPAKLRPALAEAYKVIKEVGAELEGVGYEGITRDATYFPRGVRDVEGLSRTLGRDQRTALEKFIIKETKKKKVKSLSPVQREAAITKFLKGEMQKGGGGLSNAKQRSIGYVSDEMLPHYIDPVHALTKYIDDAVGDIEMKKFFNESHSGGSLKNFREVRDIVDADGDAIIDNALGEMMIREGVSDIDATELREIFSARFGAGRRGANKVFGGLRDLSTVSALGNFASTVTQVGDLVSSLYRNGIRPTLKAGMDAITDSGKLGLDDVGMNRIISMDLSSHSPLSRLVEGTLKATGFAKLDRFGKRTLINGAFYGEGRKLANTGKKGHLARKAFRKKWGDIYGDNTEVVLNDLRNGVVSDDTKLHVFHMLSDVQPITQLELPTAYLNNPNHRIMYTLKSHALKQLDILRNDVYNKALTKGERTEAAANLTRFMLLYGSVNGTITEVKDVIRGDEFHGEDIPFNAFDQLTSLAFMGKYARDAQLKEGKIAEWVINNVTPAAPTGVNNLIPVIGQVIEDHLLGGKEERKKRGDKERRERNR